MVHETRTKLESVGKTALKDRSILARNIVARREALNWNQSELAHKVGVHVNIIKKIETDNGEGSLETRKAIAGALGCTLSDLYAPIDKTQLIPDVAASIDLLSKFSIAPPTFQRIVLALLYRDPSYVRGIQIPPDLAADIARLFAPTLKVKI